MAQHLFLQVGKLKAKIAKQVSDRSGPLPACSPPQLRTWILADTDSLLRWEGEQDESLYAFLCVFSLGGYTENGLAERSWSRQHTDHGGKVGSLVLAKSQMNSVIIVSERWFVK